MRIFGPLPWPTISPVTVTPASACASLVTVSPSTSSSAGRVTVSPASPARRLTVNRSPTATLCWRPPALTTAYTTNSSIDAFMSCAHTGADHRCAGRAVRPPGGTARCPARDGATRPAYPSGAAPVDAAPITLGPAGPPDGWPPGDGAAAP